MSSRITCLFCTFLGGALVLFVAPAEARPVVLVDVDVSELPPDFDPQGKTVPQNLKERFETEAITTTLDPQFKLFEWKAASAAPATAMPTLRLVLKAERSVTWQVYFEARCVVPKITAPAGEFIGNSADVYSNQQQLPSASRIEKVTFNKGKNVLNSLLGAKSEELQSKLVSRIALATDLDIGPNDAKWFVVPLKAGDIQAHPDSKFEARLITDHPARGMMPAFFVVNPAGPIYSNGLVGLLQCNLEEFRFAGVTSPTWVPDVPIVVQHRMTGKVRIHVVKYVRDYMDASFYP